MHVTASQPMYQSYFHLNGRPFASAANPEHYFPAASIEQAREVVALNVERASGATMVMGWVGSGKTLLCQLIANQFSGELPVCMIPGSRLQTREAFFQSILYGLGLPHHGQDEGQLRLTLTNHVTGQGCVNGILLILDEADRLPRELLEEVRVLTNLVKDGQPCIRLVLVGTHALEEAIAHPELESLQQRIVGRQFLENFSPDETRDYISARIQACGGEAETIFTDDGLHNVYRATNGVPRLVNQICDHALLMASVANVSQLDGRVVEEAWADLQQLPVPADESGASHSTGDAQVVVEFGVLDEDDPDPVVAQIDDIQRVVTALDSEHSTPQESSVSLGNDDVEVSQDQIVIEVPGAESESAGPEVQFEFGGDSVANAPETESPQQVFEFDAPSEELNAGSLEQVAVEFDPNWSAEESTSQATFEFGQNVEQEPTPQATFEFEHNVEQESTPQATFEFEQSVEQEPTPQATFEFEHNVEQESTPQATFEFEQNVETNQYQSYTQDSAAEPSDDHDREPVEGSPSEQQDPPQIADEIVPPLSTFTPDEAENGFIEQPLQPEGRLPWETPGDEIEPVQDAEPGEPFSANFAPETAQFQNMGSSTDLVEGQFEAATEGTGRTQYADQFEASTEATEQQQYADQLDVVTPPNEFAGAPGTPIETARQFETEATIDQVTNPFDEEFDEEEIVIQEFASPSKFARFGHDSVSSAYSRRLAEQLTAAHPGLRMHPSASDIDDESAQSHGHANSDSRGNVADEFAPLSSYMQGIENAIEQIEERSADELLAVPPYDSTDDAVMPEEDVQSIVSEMATDLDSQSFESSAQDRQATNENASDESREFRVDTAVAVEEQLPSAQPDEEVVTADKPTRKQERTKKVFGTLFSGMRRR